MIRKNWALPEAGKVKMVWFKRLVTLELWVDQLLKSGETST